MFTFILFVALFALGFYSLKMTYKYTDRDIPFGYELFGEKEIKASHPVSTNTFSAEEFRSSQKKLHDMTVKIIEEQDYNVNGEGGMFVITQTKGDNFLWEFRANNNRTIASSKVFKTRQGVKSNLISFLENLTGDTDFSIRFRIPEKE